MAKKATEGERIEWAAELGYKPGAGELAGMFTPRARRENARVIIAVILLGVAGAAPFLAVAWSVLKLGGAL